MKFINDIEEKVKKAGFELINEEENIWILEKKEESVTISGDDIRVECMWQNFDGSFEENESNDIDNIIRWINNKIKA
jgi:hypothetical protein